MTDRCSRCGRPYEPVNDPSGRLYVMRCLCGRSPIDELGDRRIFAVQLDDILPSADVRHEDLLWRRAS